MQDAVTLRIHYPLPEGARLWLRTELDWDHSLPPVPAEDARVHTFRVPTDRSYFYFKPLLETAAGEFWSVGSNYLALRGDVTKEVYPFFFGGLQGTLTDVITLDDGQGRQHRARFYLPPGYVENSLKRYPVLYMNDGSNLFFPDEAFLGVEWQVDETMDTLNDMNVIDKVIVAAVYPGDRMVEYTSPGYQAYGRFLVETVKPFVDRTFRTLSEPCHTAVMGSSLGGVVSLYLAVEHPEVFGMAGCLSSTFGYQDDLEARVLRGDLKDVRLYLDSGWPEDNFERTLSMRNALIRSGRVFGRDFLYFAFPRARHDESFWATRSHLPFQFFFGNMPRKEHLDPV